MIDSSYEGFNDVSTIVGDVLVYGNTREESNDNLRAVLERSRSVGIKLNNEKLEVGVAKMKYFGR